LGVKGLVELVAAEEQIIADGLVQPVASALKISLMLWAYVHGIASLRITEPDMPCCGAIVWHPPGTIAVIW
jgi:hypothetical protein